MTGCTLFETGFGHAAVAWGEKGMLALESGERRRPYRSLASWYLWQALELGRDAP